MKYKDDLLETLSSLNNHEVFTPPHVAEDMLDLLPEEVWKNPNHKFLDPATKTGVFLRGIIYRLNEKLPRYKILSNGKKEEYIHIHNEGGVDEAIYNLNDNRDRIDHIRRNMVYGISTSELTGYISRRTIYGVNKADSDRDFGVINKTKLKTGDSSNATYNHNLFEYLDNKLDREEGNIFYANPEHSFDKNDNCEICGMSKKEAEKDSMENYAYAFIHEKVANKIKNLKDIKKMKFDVIIGNPPYQINVGNKGKSKAKSKAIYHLFINMSIKLKPTYISMIVPSRWMTKAADGISDIWVENMINSNKIKYLKDYISASDIFPSIELKGGVNYFLWDKNYSGECEYILNKKGFEDKRFEYLNNIGADIVIRDIKSSSILKKINIIEGNYFLKTKENFSSMVSSKDYFTNKIILTSSWLGFSKTQTQINNIKCYLNKKVNNGIGWISEDIVPKNKGSIKKSKIYIPASSGSGSDKIILGEPFIGDENSVCSQTYLVIGFDPIKHNFTNKENKIIIKYLKTKFVRFLISIRKRTQSASRDYYKFVPLQDFSKEWTDEILYKKYNLTQEEIDYIESSIKEME